MNDKGRTMRLAWCGKVSGNNLAPGILWPGNEHPTVMEHPTVLCEHPRKVQIFVTMNMSACIGVGVLYLRVYFGSLLPIV